ncbi:uncharacterized protein EDB91DRAFT_15328 [Suillus paluster]|uniref:uncharacterized protein n=1 Tax=Suillus paluster TaxID=48578 RepID=UPI001B86E92D|nr:uncharacterized protein EDB91DRAFT_15328 [Suillus paluster]KAG1756433.1 hypothetical protein EDB91DRAFT_15328 [Suillus paluster]
MTLVSDDPSWLPVINASRNASYFVVAASAGMMYDWVLTFGQEVELVWRQHWSLMTFLYFSVRYVGILYAVVSILHSVPTIPVTDVVSFVMLLAQDWTNVIVNIILGVRVIMIARLYAMYQQSRKMLVLLVVIFLAINITNVVIAAIPMRHISGEEFILFGTYQCRIKLEGDALTLGITTSVLTIVWEVLALCLAVWIAVKHFRELRRQSAGGSISNFFTVLMKTHVVYFASFLAVSCSSLVYLSPAILGDFSSLEAQIYSGVLEFCTVVQMFVLGPRLILSVREYHAKLVADWDAAITMTSIAFQERTHVSTGSSV